MGLSKLLHLCHTFIEHRGELDRKEQHEIISFAKTCLPVFLKQVHRFLVAVRGCAGAMRVHARQELAAHFVPEVRSVLK